MQKILIFLLLINLSYQFDVNKKTLKVFVIEINPILTSITNKDLYKNNNGHPYVTEYFSQKREKSVSEMVNDIKFASHGKLTVQIVKHAVLNEFPKYTSKIKLSNGKYDFKYDEKTYISMSKSDQKDKGDWFKLIRDPLFSDSFKFDYDYIINKYNLITLREKKFFDQVWIFGVDPLGAFETMMVGSNPYWINGTPLKKDCKNFLIAGFALARRDSSLHALGHGLENLISFGFSGDYNKYTDNVITQEEYNKFNYWEKFTLINKNTKNGNAGVGNVHFPFNGISDYDYSNTNQVYSYWESWLDYPNINGAKKLSNNKAWMELSENVKILQDPEEEQNPDRLYVRFWMYLFPHIDGYTAKGQLNNWWSYFSNLDYVTQINSQNQMVTGYVGKEVELNYNVYYRSGDIENIKYAKQDKNVHINGNCVKFNNNKQLIGAQKGKCTVSIFRDGQKVTIVINVLAATTKNLRKFINFKN